MLFMSGIHIKPQLVGHTDIEESVLISKKDKIDYVLADPKFGMFSLFAYHIARSDTNVFFCSHVFSLILALPILIFVVQWTMYISILTHQIRIYDVGICPNRASVEEKTMMATISLFYFIKSFFLWDNIVDRTHRLKMMPSDSYIVMLDTFQEFGFNLVVYLTNLWIIFTERDFMSMFFNMLAMEFLMDMDNEFERVYFSYLPEVAVNIYDTIFVTYAKNISLITAKTTRSCRFRYCRRLTYIPYKIIILLFLCLPGICFFIVFFGAICK